MCVDSTMHNMGTASKLFRLMIIIVLGIILWRLWYYVTPLPQVTNMEVGIASPVLVGEKLTPHADHLETVVPKDLQVVVYYEALCPDSRDFIVRELTPVYNILSASISLTLVPYGKATSEILSDGSKVFKCQHGETECRANIVHACTTKYVPETQTCVDIISCMIDLNLRSRNPISDGKKCVAKFDSDWDVIEHCSTTDEGTEILYRMGQMTHDLQPPVTFIPTITINGSREHQNIILRDLKKALCDAYEATNAPSECNAV